MSNQRASLLANLRTGGVRPPTGAFPQSAAPHVTSFQHTEFPMTAGLGGSFPPMYAPQPAPEQQQQAFQMQAMQMEIMRLQAIQQTQQLQLELARQQQQQLTPRYASQSLDQFNSSAQVAALQRRVSQADQLKAMLRLNTQVANESQTPMTASLSGKFGGRLNPHAAAFNYSGYYEEVPAHTPIGPRAPLNTPVTPAQTSILSGGTPLGLAGSGGQTPIAMTPSKSDASVNWRRGSNSPPNDQGSGERAPPLSARLRPQPLRFSNAAISSPLSAIAVENADAEESDETSSDSSNKTGSSPTTPHTSSSLSSSGSLSMREEASKRLYEGLGMGRLGVLPSDTAVTDIHEAILPTSNIPVTVKLASHPVRQPLGPPSAADELGPRNFATRIRKTIIGDISAMLNARVTRDITAY